jgi:hypothetical protein
MPKGLGTQIIAGILGLLFVVGLVLLGRRLGQDLRTRFLAQRGENAQDQSTPNATPTPTKTPAFQALEKRKGDTLAAQSTGIKGDIDAKEIPRTGPETLLLTSLLLPTGIYLRKKF